MHDNCHVDDLCSVGRHLLVDMYGIQPQRLTHEQQLMQLLLQSLEQAGFHVVGQCSHKFPGSQSGVTGMVLLSESHASFHTYPEHEFMALDIFSCGRPVPEDVVAAVAHALQPARTTTFQQTRGDRRNEGRPHKGSFSA